MAVVRRVLCAALILSLSGAGVAAQEFGAFRKEPINAPGSYAVVADPTGKAPAAQVHSFTIMPGKCSSRGHGDGTSDCTHNSVRAQAYEKAQSQPTDAWYAWSFYFPRDFPVGGRQPAGGFYSFAYWHNGKCPHLALVSETGNGTSLSLQTNLQSGSGCLPDQRLPVADISSLRGGWHRVEMHVIWSKGADGLAEIYLDGRLKTALKGRTLTAGGEAKNYFKFGVYLCCTASTERIAAATMYYTTPRRAGTRDGLR